MSKAGAPEIILPFSTSRLVADIAQVGMGSLVMLSAGGSGVFFQPNFTLAGGFSDPTLTLPGATMTFAPQTLNLGSNGQYVTVVFEVENKGASGINVGTLALSVEGVRGSVPAAPGSVPQLDDADGNGIEDLLVKFDRQALIQLLRNSQTNTPLVRAAWNATDGTSSTASAWICILR